MLMPWRLEPREVLGDLRGRHRRAAFAADAPSSRPHAACSRRAPLLGSTLARLVHHVDPARARRSSPLASISSRPRSRRPADLREASVLDRDVGARSTDCPRRRARARCGSRRRTPIAGSTGVPAGLRPAQPASRIVAAKRPDHLVCFTVRLYNEVHLIQSILVTDSPRRHEAHGGCTEEVHALAVAVSVRPHISVVIRLTAYNRSLATCLKLRARTRESLSNGY